MSSRKLKDRLKSHWRLLRRSALERALPETFSWVELGSYAAVHALPTRKLIPAALIRRKLPIFFRDNILCNVSGCEGSEPQS